uniref:Bromo domain-containing protein n=1 Tax=Anopheles farauti TaxID=69004 RepID=A0A182Q2L2_9DIPT
MYPKSMVNSCNTPAPPVYTAACHECTGMPRFSMPPTPTPPPYLLIGSLRQEFSNQALKAVQVMKTHHLLPHDMLQYETHSQHRMVVFSEMTQTTIVNPAVSQYWTHPTPRFCDSIHLFNSVGATPTTTYMPSSNRHAVTQSPPVTSTFDTNLGSRGLGNNVTANSNAGSERDRNGNREVPNFQNARQATNNNQVLDQLHDLLKIALDGCKKAETLAANHQKRPCFKKIDSLCARLKQDLLKPGNVMSNIRSQGLAWAVKDFIFVFTRIMNAWIIIKGYTNSDQEELSSIQRELCPNFLQAFGHWHAATYKLIQSIITSFINLNKLAKAQRCGDVHFPKASEPMKPSNDDELSNDPFDGAVEADTPNMVDGTYYRTGIYNTGLGAPPGYENLSKSAKRKHDIRLKDEKTSILRSSKTEEDMKHHKFRLNSSDSSELTAKTVEPIKTEDYQDKKFVSKRINWVLDKVRAIDEAQYFYCLNFSKNYFPDYHLVASTTLDLRAIYMKNESGQYSSLVELLDDFQIILHTCNRYITASTAFDLWIPHQEHVPDFWKPISRVEIEHFPKMATFVEKMERLMDVVRKLDL